MNIKDQVLNYQSSLINDLVEWLKIRSVLDTKSANDLAPFGLGVKKSLDYIYNLALKDGFKATNYDGYCVEIEYGSGDELILMMAHADVVPEGEGWTHDPYDPIIKNNLLFARGASDDKGPGMCAYYALKYLKDNNIVPSKTIRLVFGGNEENGSRCLDYYFNVIKRPHPTYGFTPDAEFPLIYGEKGIYSYKFYGYFKDNLIESIQAGDAINAVPNKAIFVLNKEIFFTDDFYNCINKYGVKMIVNYKNNKTIMQIIGKSAHASTPELGINALTIGLFALKIFYNSKLADHFGIILNDYTGLKLKIRTSSKEMGKLTCNVGKGVYDGNHYEFYLNIRYPNSTDATKLTNKLRLSIMHKGEMISNSNPLFVDPNSKFIQVLLKAYRDVTKDMTSKPMVIGGGTYARETINSVAFGMDFQRNNGTGNIHGVDEAINLDDLIDGLEIYIKALLGLLEL